jgi:predicted transcriptional regulator
MMPDITDEMYRVIRREWIAGVTQAEICRMVGISVDAFRRSAKLKKLPGRGRRTGSGKRGEDPTEEQIQERAAAIRASWDEATRASRL